MKNNNVFDCGKCNGTGFISAFSSYANGRCFQCNGSGKIALSELEKRMDVWLEYYKSKDTDELRYAFYYPNGESEEAQVIVDFKTFTGDRTKYRKLWLEWESKGKTVVNAS